MLHAFPENETNKKIGATGCRKAACIEGKAGQKEKIPPEAGGNQNQAGSAGTSEKDFSFQYIGSRKNRARHGSAGRTHDARMEDFGAKGNQGESEKNAGAESPLG